MLTEKDLNQLKNKQIAETEIYRQLEIFKKGVPFAQLEDSATIENGIVKCTEPEEAHLTKLYDDKVPELSVLKLVPASGAASRMFKALFDFLEHFDPDKTTIQQYIINNQAEAIERFIKNIEKFPFYNQVVKAMQPESFQFTNAKDGRQISKFIEKMLLTNGFSYGSLPKGLLPFHQYKNKTTTAFEEHLYEAALYSKTGNKAKLHFTISKDHEKAFKNELNSVLERVQKDTQTTFEVTFSFQKEKTDTISVTPENELFRDKNQNLVFRPSGHGALIENLNEQDADVIFIKNIDNVVVENLRPDTAFYKKVLAGKLLEVQEKAFHYAEKLDANQLEEQDLNEVFTFLRSELNVRFSGEIENLDSPKKIQLLKESLHKPIRVCGMVKNQGEPGGGPFWVKNHNGEISLQIIESAQINKKDESQNTLLQSSTHFNPVDIVCAVKNYKGEKYHLLDFVDTRQGFITAKTYQGKPLKGLELPGLWNGAMAYWNTIFMEVPLSTFNPVKTVLDLLKESHQPKK